MAQAKPEGEQNRQINPGIAESPPEASWTPHKPFSQALLAGPAALSAISSWALRRQNSARGSLAPAQRHGDTTPSAKKQPHATKMSAPRTARSITGRTNTARSEGSATGRRKALNRASAGATPRAPSQPAGQPSERGAFGRTQLSRTSPLRSVLLDPEVNNLPPARTQTEYAEFVRTRNKAHRSYDLDEDGQVTVQDYKLAASLDTNGDGRLDTDRHKEGGLILAERFFERQIVPAKFHGDCWTAREGREGFQENARRLANSQHFGAGLRMLEMREKRLLGRASLNMTACMQAPRGPDEGPRSHLLAHRKRTERLFGQAQLDKWDAKMEKWSTKRVSPISNLAFENG